MLTARCGVRRLQDWQVCQVSVGVLGDICRAIEEAVAPYCDRVMAVLLASLQVIAAPRYSWLAAPCLQFACAICCCRVVLPWACQSYRQ